MLSETKNFEKWRRDKVLEAGDGDIYVLCALGDLGLVTSTLVSVQRCTEGDSTQGTNRGTRGENALKVGISDLGKCSQEAESTTMGMGNPRAAHGRL